MVGTFRIPFRRVWQIQRRIFVNGKYITTEVLAEVEGGFKYARRLFRDLTGLEPKDRYYKVSDVMSELNYPEKTFHDAYAQACKIAFDRNFIVCPFDNEKGYYAYGIKCVLTPTDSNDQKLS